MPYDLPGDPQLARSWAARSENRDDTWITAVDDPYLPIHYRDHQPAPVPSG